MIEPEEILPCEFGVVAFDNGEWVGWGSKGSVSWQINDMKDSPITGTWNKGRSNYGRRLNVAYETVYKYVI